MFDEYATITVIFIVIFAMVYSFLFVICDNILCRKAGDAFQKMDKQKKAEYVGRIVSSIHATLVTVTSSIACFFVW